MLLDENKTYYLRLDLHYKKLYFLFILLLITIIGGGFILARQINTSNKLQSENIRLTELNDNQYSIIRHYQIKTGILLDKDGNQLN